MVQRVRWLPPIRTVLLYFTSDNDNVNTTVQIEEYLSIYYRIQQICTVQWRFSGGDPPHVTEVICFFERSSFKLCVRLFSIFFCTVFINNDGTVVSSGVS